jgi:hypothetical protein
MQKAIAEPGFGLATVTQGGGLALTSPRTVRFDRPAEFLITYLDEERKRSRRTNGVLRRRDADAAWCELIFVISAWIGSHVRGTRRVFL